MLAGRIACWSMSVDAADAEKAEGAKSQGLCTPKQKSTDTAGFKRTGPCQLIPHR